MTTLGKALSIWSVIILYWFGQKINKINKLSKNQ